MIPADRQEPLFKHRLYLSDGGLETSLIFLQGIALKDFAAFELLNDETGRKALTAYYLPYLEMAHQSGLPFVLETPTWRANQDWGSGLGYSREELFTLNKRSVQFMRELARPFESSMPQIILSGNIGPRGDGYRADSRMTIADATAYHLDQVRAFALADADLITALTITYSNEAAGIVNAARLLHLPVVISFTVETNGALPGGESLEEAIRRTDAATDNYATHFMINCAHPDHFLHVVKNAGEWTGRIGGIRANASSKSHAELDECATLDPGDRNLLAAGYRQLFEWLPSLKVIGGCCGTDHTHIAVICKAMLPGKARSANSTNMNQ